MHAILQIRPGNVRYLFKDKSSIISNLTIFAVFREFLFLSWWSDWIVAFKNEKKTHQEPVCGQITELPGVCRDCIFCMMEVSP